MALPLPFDAAAGIVYPDLNNCHTWNTWKPSCQMELPPRDWKGTAKLRKATIFELLHKIALLFFTSSPVKKGFPDWSVP